MRIAESGIGLKPNGSAQGALTAETRRNGGKRGENQGKGKTGGNGVGGPRYPVGPEG
ncbi:hypothetical protein SBA4_2010014 [Candidatus Sulfopaludibacter sp. SbA4]|nr:hypothetical protein SBA4_2010014 [Candidatus Sulfopaludibacter sp. SbA4]